MHRSCLRGLQMISQLASSGKVCSGNGALAQAGPMRRFTTARISPASFSAPMSVGASGAVRTTSRLHAVAAPVTPAKDIDLPKAAHGFTLVRDEFIQEYGSRVAIFRHDATGAECMSVSNDDENKTFGAVFRTPVDDSTGIPHILEHSVLNGSKKYPVKEPFVELIKGSLHTFINAFTYPDRTCYPVASTNLQDFHNLCDVYLDAVFHPRCLEDPQVFQQEGWHYELEKEDASMVLKGVVFNEMKGVYSQPDSVHYEAIQSQLFPDNNYASNSGGDPEVIPDLTFAKFKDFHARYYHPSNARFWFYGDDPVEERLKKVGGVLAEFQARTDIESLVPVQPLFSETRNHVHYYAAGDEGEGADEKKAFASVNWVMTADELDLETQVALSFLDYLLTGTSASPLRKAITDSGLGESIIGGGMDDTLRQPTYSMGLKGVAPADVEKVEQLVLEEMYKIRKEGFSQSAIDAAINTTEFSLRENNTGRFPRGLSMMLRAMGAWVYDRDPYNALKWEGPLGDFKARLAAGEDVFGELMDKYLLNNKHRVTVITLPDSQLGAQIEAKEQKRIESARSQMSAEDVEKVVKETEELKKRQATPDSPEALACIPSLQLSDIPKEAASIPTAVSSADKGPTLLTHDMFTNNVLYADIALPLNRVPARLLPLLPLFCRSLLEMGTGKESFIELTERIDRTTGGLSISPSISHKRGADEPVALMMVRGKAMADKVGDLMELMNDILLTAKLDDRDRFTQMVLETKAGMEAGVVGSGHSFAASRLAAQRSTAGWVNEQIGGVEYLHYIRDLAKRVESDWDSIHADLREIQKLVLSVEGSYVNMTADSGLLKATEPHLNELTQAIQERQTGEPIATGSWAQALDRANEALLVPTQVNYVGKAANLFEDVGYDLHGAAYVVNNQLGMTHIWDRVRVMGGAYGGFCSFDSHSGLFSYLSYRDPNLLSTVQAYDDTPAFLREISMDQDSLTKAIIGTIGDVDSYQLPDAKGRTAFMRHLLGVTDEERQMRREQILATTNKDFREFAEVLEAVRGPEARVVAVTSKGAVEKAHAEQKDFFEKVTTIM